MKLPKGIYLAAAYSLLFAKRRDFLPPKTPPRTFKRLTKLPADITIREANFLMRNLPEKKRARLEKILKASAARYYFGKAKTNQMAMASKLARKSSA